MKTALPRVAAGLLAAAIPLAFAHTAPAPTYVQEPIASSSVNDAAGPVSAIVQQLNADASMKGSKITVQPDGETVIMTGVAPTYMQVVAASKIAASHAGEGKVVNAITTEEIILAAPPPAVSDTAAVAEEPAATEAQQAAPTAPPAT